MKDRSQVSSLSFCPAALETSTSTADWPSDPPAFDEPSCQGWTSSWFDALASIVSGSTCDNPGQELFFSLSTNIRDSLGDPSTAGTLHSSPCHPGGTSLPHHVDNHSYPAKSVEDWLERIRPPNAIHRTSTFEALLESL